MEDGLAKSMVHEKLYSDTFIGLSGSVTAYKHYHTAHWLPFKKVLWLSVLPAMLALFPNIAKQIFTRAKIRRLALRRWLLLRNGRRAAPSPKVLVLFDHRGCGFWCGWCC